MIDTIDEDDIVSIEKRLDVEALAAIITNFVSDGIDKYVEMVRKLYIWGSYIYALNKLYLDLKNKLIAPAKLFISKPPKFGAQVPSVSSVLCVFRYR